MKFLKTGLSVALAVTGLALVPSTTSAAVGAAAARPGDDSSAAARLRAAADGNVRITTKSATGKVGFISARGAGADLLPDVDANSRESAAKKAEAYLTEFGSAFGLGAGQARQTDVQQDRYGWTVTFEQEYQGLPVFGATLKANLDKAGDLTAVAGYAAPVSGLSTDPRLTAEAAAAKAVAFVKADPPTGEKGTTADTTGVKAVENELSVYRTGALRGDTGKNILAYVVEVSNAQNVRDMVFIDANTGKPVNRYSTVAGATDRELYEATGTAQAPVITQVWDEGQSLDGLNQDQKNLVNSAGESYWMFANTFGRDSYDGEGATMRTVNNDPRISCPNANWNGTTTNYCDGVTSDDVVSHEWGHAYTEYTSGLIYQYQSGALNESYSDVWGETLDMINGREDEGEVFDAKRTVGECDPTAAAKLQVQITAPANVAGPCTAAFGFGPTYGTTAVTPQVVVANDAADAAGPSTTDGCSPFANALAVSGKYAFVDRGTCGFQAKADNAVAAGATGLVVGQNAAGLPTNMSGTSTIPALMVTQADATRIKSAGTVTMSIKAEDISARTPTTRWLIGEKSEAFGGAIRDMWNPTCYGNPGKVSDAEYNCDPLLTDSGGVHGNSGVPNHAYALVVDGGTFNGETIAGIGLDKAAAIWWRAQTSYLSPSSDFTAAADGLEASCSDLVGQPINKLTTAVDATPTAAPSITAADCTSVAKAMTAVEMRKDPVQCNFQPLLAKGTLSSCGEGTVTETTVLDDFENGLDAWTKDEVLAEGATEGFDWEASTDAPAGRTGGLAYAPDPDAGACAPNEDDISSSNSITSPEYTIPAGQSPRVSVDHYIATEGGYDGGNVKASLNGGAFVTVPASAFLFNAYNATMATSATNTSPLAGQPGFTGTDGGKTIGSWGQSVISLAKLGAKTGDKVKIRFDFGRDGCGGNDGWYLDNLTLSVCKEAADLTAKHQPNPSVYGKSSKVVVSAPTEATGTVTLKSGAKTVGSATLVDGSATISVPAKSPAGRYGWTLSYEGDGTFGASETPVAATIKKASTATKVVRYVKVVKRGKKGSVTVKVSSAAGAPNGKVVLKSRGAIIGTGTLRSGVVTIKTIALRKLGQVPVVARFTGAPNYGVSAAKTITFRVVK
ncbi:M4 family metallopeptidase [Nocardioides sp. 1609]|uniref:M4 family metallopeptidase n=1 Tax=Nocardioides sp. 1609 TaxID=2508327 RepID=UPI00143129F2|nr:M4 family metallopeptidase [Nocardioides sp. 1609]